jgi:hypothetical protein
MIGLLFGPPFSEVVRMCQIPGLGVEPLLELNAYGRILGLFEHNNVGIRDLSPLPGALKVGCCFFLLFPFLFSPRKGLTVPPR